MSKATAAKLRDISNSSEEARRAAKELQIRNEAIAFVQAIEDTLDKELNAAALNGRSYKVVSHQNERFIELVMKDLKEFCEDRKLALHMDHRGGWGRNPKTWYLEIKW